MVEGLKLKILELLKEDARRSPELIATMLDASVEEVKRAIDELEKDHVIVKYAAVVNWSKVEDDKVTALIEVQITPERGRGFEGIAERIYLFPEVKSVFLMSGAYDLLVEVEGQDAPGSRILRIEQVVADRLRIVDEDVLHSEKI